MPAPENADNQVVDLLLDDEPPAKVTENPGRRLVRDLLEDHPGAAITVVDATKNIGNARELLAKSGIDIGRHTMLRGTAAAEFVAPTDAYLVSAALVDARDRGVGTRLVHMKDRREATLHLVKVDEPHLSTGFVMVIVPSPAGRWRTRQSPAESSPQPGSG